MHPKFIKKTRNGKNEEFKTWSGKTIHQMAKDVEHLDVYEVFYSELSAFPHVNIHGIGHFLQKQDDGSIIWSQRVKEEDVGNVFKYAVTFLICFLKLFGRQFNTWPENRVENCWNVN